jgi:hypothetical protein
MWQQRCVAADLLRFGQTGTEPKNFKHKYSERKIVLVKGFVKLENTSA